MTTFDTDTLSEGDALDILSAFQARFGWAVQVFTRNDADDTLSIFRDETLTDDEWAEVRSTDEWTKSLSQPDDTAYDIITYALEEAGLIDNDIDNDNDKEY